MNLAIIQPILTKYREPLFSALGHLEGVNVIVLAESPPKSYGDIEPEGFVFISVQWRRFFDFYLISPLRLLRELKEQDKIIHFVDYKYLSLWFCLFLNSFWRKQVFLHGHGGYKRQGFFASFVHSVYLLLASGYVCYCEYSAQNLRSITPKFLHKKISVVPNSLYLSPEKSPIRPNDADRIFYVGRVRERCGLDLLLQVADQLDLSVEVIGGGDTDYEQRLEKLYKSARFHGTIYDDEEQRQIARKCFCGVYAGDAGLSVVHYMAFGLPVVVHGDMRKHMGPEPSYVIDGENGLFFQRENSESLKNCLRELVSNKEKRFALAENALATFNGLQSPLMHDRFAQILGVSNK